MMHSNDKYRKNNVRVFNLRFFPSEKLLYAWLKNQDNMAGYVKNLIREDIERQNPAFLEQDPDTVVLDVPRVSKPVRQLPDFDDPNIMLG